MILDFTLPDIMNKFKQKYHETPDLGPSNRVVCPCTRCLNFKHPRRFPQLTSGTPVTSFRKFEPWRCELGRSHETTFIPSTNHNFPDKSYHNISAASQLFVKQYYFSGFMKFGRHKVCK